MRIQELACGECSSVSSCGLDPNRTKCHKAAVQTSACDLLTCHVEDAITGSDVRQEGVPQALARMGSLHQACDVHHIKECWDLAANQGVKTNETWIWIHLGWLQQSVSEAWLKLSKQFM